MCWVEPPPLRDGTVNNRAHLGSFRNIIQPLFLQPYHAQPSSLYKHTAPLFCHLYRGVLLPSGYFPFFFSLTILRCYATHLFPSSSFLSREEAQSSDTRLSLEVTSFFEFLVSSRPFNRHNMADIQTAGVPLGGARKGADSQNVTKR